ncbi:MAG TPA: UDP-N-acetylmuramoyl-L-alanine--D-glutamate ligase [Lentimicrobium sp.]|nr:UDP-N-acetylmuramoyl-L-alanine--D-glutamate ligase [Lentimicrobium sp.]
MKEYLKSHLKGKKVLVLGFGKEGKSTIKMLSSLMSDIDITISDQNETAFDNTNLMTDPSISIKYGDNYLSDLTEYDVVIKSPGIKLDPHTTQFNKTTITSQTDIFLAVYGKQTIGVTGTKGKSTTSSLIYHILHTYNANTVFGGNIGIPLFDLVDDINPQTTIVCELSSHQLQFIRSAPHIAILLNLYQEHLDHYSSYLEYQQAKYNIALNQEAEDFFIFNASDHNILALINSSTPPGILIPFNENSSTQHGICISEKEILFNNKPLIKADFHSNLTGTHNRNNAIIAAAAASLAGVPEQVIEVALSSFIPLEHRLEYVGTYGQVKFYNDSISTIPEAAIAAVESLKPVSTLIVGGFDRGIDYRPLAEYLENGNVRNIVATGPAGLRIFEIAAEIAALDELYYINQFDEAVRKAIEITPPGGSVLLSPAASSYNEFINFEQRGKRFKELVKV